MNINAIINSIYSLNITDENYNFYRNLLDLPRNIFIQVLIGLIEGSIKPNDSEVIFNKYKVDILADADNIGLKRDMTLKDRIKQKYLHGEVTSVFLLKNNISEQIYIRDKALKDDIPLIGDEWKDIFTNVGSFEEINLNFDKIYLTPSDIVFMRDNGLDEIQMKKLKLLKNHLILRRNFGMEKEE